MDVGLHGVGFKVSFPPEINQGTRHWEIHDKCMLKSEKNHLHAENSLVSRLITSGFLLFDTKLVPPFWFDSGLFDIMIELWEERSLASRG